jgi:hypothetical protein
MPYHQIFVIETKTPEKVSHWPWVREFGINQYQGKRSELEYQQPTQTRFELIIHALNFLFGFSFLAHSFAYLQDRMWEIQFFFFVQYFCSKVEYRINADLTNWGGVLSAYKEKQFVLGFIFLYKLILMDYNFN